MSKKESIDYLTMENVWQGVSTLRQMAVVAKAIEQRGVTVHGVVYDVGTGLIDVVEECE